MTPPVAARRDNGAPATTTDKRVAILDAATRVFLSAGYGSASMDAIARHAGVSKQTIYAHFGDKASLFEAIVLAGSDRLIEPIEAAIGAAEPPSVALVAIGRRYVEVVMGDQALARFRVVVGECGRFPELAQVFYRSGPERAMTRFADYLAAENCAGRLTVANPWLAADQFFGMLRGDPFLRRLLDLDGTAATDTGSMVEQSVAVFLAVYGRSA